MSNPLNLQKIVKKDRNNKNDNKRRKHHSKSRNDSTDKTGLFISDKSCTIDCNRTRSRFCNHSYIHHIFMTNPFLFLYTIFFYQGNNGITATKGKRTYFTKSNK